MTTTPTNVRELLLEESQLQSIATKLGGMAIGLEQVDGSAAAQKELRLLKAGFVRQLEAVRERLNALSQQCDGHDMQHTYGRSYQCTKCGHEYLA